MYRPPQLYIEGVCRIGQVLSNLLSNAAKFSPDTSPIQIAANSDTVMVTVDRKSVV